MGGYALSVWNLMIAMDPDEFATFLSGAFAPLAFLWLVLGFRQQGDELRNSAQALWLQGEELRNSVEQQRRLVEVSREQLSAEYAERLRIDAEQDKLAQPRLLLSQAGGTRSGGRVEFRYNLICGGPACTNVIVRSNEKIVMRKPLMGVAEENTLRFIYEPGDIVGPLDLHVNYDDSHGRRRQQSFVIPVVEHGDDKISNLGSPSKTPGYEKLDPAQSAE